MTPLLVCLCAVCLVWPTSALAQAAPPVPAAVPPVFRLFLVDGTEVATFGEFARLEGHVVASVPVGPLDVERPDLQTVTLADDRVDWARTDAYTRTVRLAQYAASTAERDYAAFTEEVAATLDRVSSTPDPLARIALVESARRRLLDWPAQHFGYRQRDADAMLGVLDDVLAGLRAAAGQQHFSLTLASGAATPPPTLAVRPAPTLRDVVTQALGLARHVLDPLERVRLLGRAAALLDGPGAWERGWARTTRREVRRQLQAEDRTTRAYTALREDALDRASRHLAAGNVRAMLGLRRDTLARDDRLGHQRPSEMAALMSALDAHLEATRQRRLTLDRWNERRPVLQAYVRHVNELLRPFDDITHALDDIRTLSGSSPVDLARAEAALAAVRTGLLRMDPPTEGEGVHALALSALQMTTRAVAARRTASVSADLQVAWEASAAAAGALMMLERTRTDLAALVAVPAAGRPTR